MPLIYNKRVFFVVVICAVIISASYYVLPPLGGQNLQLLAHHPLRWPVALVAALNVVHRIFIARIFMEGFGVPAWLGEAMGFLYWPVLGAFVGASKHWLLWGAAVLAVNIALLVLFFYALTHIRP